MADLLTSAREPGAVGARAPGFQAPGAGGRAPQPMENPNCSAGLGCSSSHDSGARSIPATVPSRSGGTQRGTVRRRFQIVGLL